jgi:hypothetical protein
VLLAHPHYPQLAIGIARDGIGFYAYSRVPPGLGAATSEWEDGHVRIILFPAIGIVLRLGSSKRRDSVNEKGSCSTHAALGEEPMAYR